MHLIAFMDIYGIYVLHVPEDQEAQAFSFWSVNPAERFMEHCMMRKRHSPKEEIGKIYIKMMFEIYHHNTVFYHV